MMGRLHASTSRRAASLFSGVSSACRSMPMTCLPSPLLRRCSGWIGSSRRLSSICVRIVSEGSAPLGVGWSQSAITLSRSKSSSGWCSERFLSALAICGSSLSFDVAGRPRRTSSASCFACLSIWKSSSWQMRSLSSLDMSFARRPDPWIERSAALNGSSSTIASSSSSSSSRPLRPLRR